MKVSHDIPIIVSIVCEHWFFGNRHEELTVNISENDWYEYDFSDNSNFEQELTNIVLNFVDKNRIYEDYQIIYRFVYDMRVFKHKVSEKVIDNWKDSEK